MHDELAQDVDKFQVSLGILCKDICMHDHKAPADHSRALRVMSKMQSAFPKLCEVLLGWIQREILMLRLVFQAPRRYTRIKNGNLANINLLDSSGGEVVGVLITKNARGNTLLSTLLKR